jgi:predicted phosphate transport protein (TIGR00153 family)
MISLFSKTKALEVQTEEFCDKVSEGSLAFRIGLSAYLAGDRETFAEKQRHVSEIESRADQLRRDIQRRLYIETLLPESRGDVLELLENTDQILNACESTMWQFVIEKPQFSDEIAGEFGKLVDTVVDSVDALVSALRAFFRGEQSISDHMHKVIFYESEADKINHRVLGLVFEGDSDLSYKNQVRHLVLHTDNIADIAEDVADRLAIFALKRAI